MDETSWPGLLLLCLFPGVPVALVGLILWRLRGSGGGMGRGLATALFCVSFAVLLSCLAWPMVRDGSAPPGWDEQTMPASWPLAGLAGMMLGIPVWGMIKSLLPLAHGIIDLASGIGSRRWTGAERRARVVELLLRTICYGLLFGAAFLCFYVLVGRIANRSTCGLTEVVR